MTRLAVLLALLTAGCRDTVQVSDVLPVEKIELHDRVAVEITNIYGRVLVRGNRGLPSRISGRLLRQARSRNEKAARRLLEQLVVAKEYRADTWSFRVQGPADTASVSANLELDVPVDSDLTVQTKRGDVTVLGVHGQVSVDADRGRLVLRGLQGPVKVTVRRAGNVTVSGALSSLEVETKRGDVEVRWPRGDLTSDGTIRTSHGDVSLVFHKALNARFRILTKARPATNLPVRGGPGEYVLETGSPAHTVVVSAPKGRVKVTRLDVVPPRIVPQKGLPPVRGGSPIQPPRTARPAVRVPVTRGGPRPRPR